MLKNSDLKLLDELFFSSYFSYVNMKKIKGLGYDRYLNKIYSDLVDVFYDGMDTVLEILDECGANK